LDGLPNVRHLRLQFLIALNHQWRQHDHEWVVGLLRQQFRQKTVQIHRREQRFGVGDPQRRAGIIFIV
jgi:hypothetical protein